MTGIVHHRLSLIDLRYRLCDIQFGIPALFLTLTGIAASAQESPVSLDPEGISEAIESAVEKSPEVSSLVDQLNQGAEVSSERLLEALKGIDGLNIDQFLQGLEGLDEDDGLLGKLASVLGPNSNGLSGILSQLGESFSGLSGSLDLGGSGAGNVLGGLLSGLPGIGSTASTTQTPTVHTTASAYTQPAVAPYTPAVTPSTYTYSYSQSVSTYTPAVSYPAASVDYNQYTVPYTPATTVPATTAPVSESVPAAVVPAVEPSATVPVSDYVAMPVSEATPAQATAKKSSGWKKAVGAVLVLGAFAGIAAVVIKKSM